MYKRDVEGIETAKDSQTTLRGNYSAHEGDALGDAALFHRDRRTDRITYWRLYGLEYGQVLEFRTFIHQLLTFNLVIKANPIIIIGE